MGTVRTADSSRAVVRVERGNCGECKGCGLFSHLSQEPVDFELPNRLGARPGDRVVLRMPAGRLIRAYLLAFGLPVAAVLAGYLLGSLVLAPLLLPGSQAPGVVLSLVLGLASFWYGLRLTRRIGLEPRMESIAPGVESLEIEVQTEENEGVPSDLVD